MTKPFVTRHIPRTEQYPGLIAHDLGHGREIVIIGDSDEAQAALEKAVRERNAGFQ